MMTGIIGCWNIAARYKLKYITNNYNNIIEYEEEIYFFMKLKCNLNWLLVIAKMFIFLYSSMLLYSLCCLDGGNNDEQKTLKR